MIGGSKLWMISNDNKHLHRVKVYSLNVDWSGIHVDCCSIRISLSGHLMNLIEIDMSRIKEAHHTHSRMVRWTHDRRRWCRLIWWRWTSNRLLSIWLVVFHSIILGCWCRRWRRRTHVGLSFNSRFDTWSTDWISSLLEFEPQRSIIDSIKSSSLCMRRVWNEDIIFKIWNNVKFSYT